MTNISCIGFKNQDNNINYYELPKEVQDILIDNFLKEMDIIKPEVIIPMGKKVYTILNILKEERRINAKLKTD